MVRMVIPKVWALLCGICPKFRCFLLVILSLASENLRMVLARIWALFSAICLLFVRKFCRMNATNGDTQGLGPIVCYLSQSFAFFAGSLKVQFQNATSGDSQGLGPIVFYLSQSFAIFCQQFESSRLKCCEWLYLGLGHYCLLFAPYCLLVVLKFRCCLLVVLMLTSRMVRMAIIAVWVVLSPSCVKVSLFFCLQF